jgi:hypothetical protein
MFEHKNHDGRKPAEEDVLSLHQLKKRYAEIETLRGENELIEKARGNVKKLSFGWRMLPKFLSNKFHRPEKFSFARLQELGVKKESFTALVDLGAFDFVSVRSGTFNAKKLAEAGLTQLVMMEDRDPMFFLNHKKFKPTKLVPLNRHGNALDLWTQADFKNLVQELKNCGIRVLIGFWGNSSNHAKNPFIRRNWKVLKPVMSLSDDINPLSFVKNKHGEEMPFAEYVVSQFQKMKDHFGIDGLFLGDGLMGYRSFLDSSGPYDASATTDLWTDFFKRIYQGIKAIDPQNTLWTFDCMGNGPNLAKKNGVNLQALTPYIDTYVFQAFGNDAWGRSYMELPGYSLVRDRGEIETLPSELKEKTLYTAGLGDKIEGWHGHANAIKQKHESISVHAKKGVLGVWSNDVVRALVKE